MGFAKPKGKEISKAANGNQGPLRLQRKAAGPGLTTTKRTGSKNSKSLKPATKKTTRQVSKKRTKRAPTTFNLFIRHVANVSRSNNLSLNGKELMNKAALCWKSLSPEDKMKFRNAKLPFKHKRMQTPNTRTENDPKPQNQRGWGGGRAYPYSMTMIYFS